MVVFLIALPLSMGIAIASGAPPAVGLATAVIGGVVVGIFGGAPLQVSGPSAGLAVLVLEMTTEHGWETFAVIVIIAGIVQLAAGVLRLGRMFQAVSPAVIRGMLAGIGTLIIAGQFHIMIDDKVHESGLANVLAIPSGIAHALADPDPTHRMAAGTGILTLITIVAWERLKPSAFRMVPGPLLGVLLAASAAYALSLPINYVTLPENLFEIFHFPTLAGLKHAGNADVLMDGIALAFVASAETLLCATAVSRMHNGPRTNYDQELAVHGVANMTCGLVGVMPMTGVISRSTANVQAGAVTRWATPLHAIWIAAVVLLAPGLLALVPMSSLAAILIYVGIKLINVKEIRKLSGYGRPVLGILFATVLGIVCIELLTGIIIGLLLSSARLMYSMSRLEASHLDHPDEGPYEIHLRGAATFVAIPALSAALELAPPKRKLHIIFDDLAFVDHAAMDLITEFRKRYEADGGHVDVEWEALMAQYRKGMNTEEVPAPREWGSEFRNTPRPPSSPPAPPQQ